MSGQPLSNAPAPNVPPDATPPIKTWVRNASYALIALGTGISFIPGGAVVGVPMAAAGAGLGITYHGADFLRKTLGSTYDIIDKYVNEKEPLFEFWRMTQEKQGNKIGPWRTPIQYLKARIQHIYLPSIMEGLSNLKNNTFVLLDETSGYIKYIPGGQPLAAGIAFAEKARTSIEEIDKKFSLLLKIQKQLEALAGVEPDTSFQDAENDLRILLKQRGVASFQEGIDDLTKNGCKPEAARSQLLSELSAQAAAMPARPPTAHRPGPEAPDNDSATQASVKNKSLLSKTRAYVPKFTAESQETRQTAVQLGIFLENNGVIKPAAKEQFLSGIDRYLEENLAEGSKNAKTSFQSELEGMSTLVIKQGGVAKASVQTLFDRTRFIPRGPLDEATMKIVCQTAALHANLPGGTRSITIHIPPNFDASTLSPRTLQETSDALQAFHLHAEKSGLKPVFNDAAQALIQRAEEALKNTPRPKL